MFRAPILITAALALAFGVGFSFLALRGCSAKESPPSGVQSPERAPAAR
jgi:hypothetical protein